MGMVQLSRPSRVPSSAAPTGSSLQEALRSLTPRVFVMQALVCVNVLVYAWMALRGVDLMNPDLEQMYAWGACFGPAIVAGEWWRLLTANFLHFGAMHLLLNMWVLSQIGGFVERLYGNVGFLLLYLVSGIAGSILSVGHHFDSVGAGASGAVFGVYGAYLAFLVMQRALLAPRSYRAMLGNTASFLLINLIYGLMAPNIGLAAHAGGLAAGFGCGCLLSLPPVRGAAAERGRLNLRLLLIALPLLAAAAAALILVARLQAGD